MRLHALTVSAFGPFQGSVAVDFDDVCSAGLFLIHGATGSGKTSLLDALCFALFADVPGARTKKGLASHHAAEGTRPLVALDFAAGGRRFRVERSPEFSRPKKRGSGMLKVNAAVTLEEWRGGEWVPVSTRHDEVAHLIEDVLGMGLAQFAKVVVLPQGDVSAFLRSSPEERRALLERLFDISTYTDVEAWFAEERRRTAAQVATAETGIRQELARLDDLVSVRDEPSWTTLDLEDVPAALISASTDLSEQVSELLAGADSAERACTTAAAALHEARTLAGLRERGRKARAVQERGEQRAGEIDGLRDQVRRAVSAEAVAGHLAGLDAAVAEQSTIAEVLIAQRSGFDRLAAGSTVFSGTFLAAGIPDGQASPAATTLIEDLAGALERLHAVAPLLTELSHARTECSRAEAAHVAAQTALGAADGTARLAAEEATRLRESRTRTQAQLERLRSVAAEHAAAEGAHSLANRRLTMARQVVDLSRGREEAAPALVAANADLLAAQTTLLSLREQQLDGMAATLAAGLVDGEPCPVCGSDDHPAPAREADIVTPEELEAAASKHDSALAIVTELKQRDTAAASRIETLLEQLVTESDDAREPGSGGERGHPAQPHDLDLDMFTERTEVTAKALAETTQARRDLVAAEAADAEAARRLATAEQAERDAARTRALAEAAVEAATARRRDALDRVSTMLQQHDQECGCVVAQEDLADSGQHIIATHAALIEQLQSVLAAERAYADALGRSRDRERAALRASAERGFETLDAARDARLAPREVEALQGRISEHDQSLAVAAATLAEDAVVEALALPEPDIDAAITGDASARKAVRAAQAAHSAAESRLNALDGVRRDVTSWVDQLTTLRSRASAVRELADAVGGTGGGNELRMRLSSFVLAARLEKVVALANERLQAMDAGRYVLEHSDAKVAGGARSGLDLRVLDQWTGRTRETASLSGGESFMVSLALALGLADAVREESGGFDLGTLFVDEGFGSLDEESLEQVLSVLDGLREGGRAVGVVSHVVDLRSRITHQVVVQKSATGSDVRVEISA